MNRYFYQCKSVNDIKSLYRELAMANHPDRGGDTATMQDINREYHEALKSQHGIKFAGFDKGKDYTYWYKQDVEQDLIDKIDELLRFKMEGVSIELIGTWIWIHGNTKSYKTEMKEAKCIWHSKRLMWYFRKFQHKTRYSDASMDALRMVYGSATCEQREKEQEGKKLELRGWK